MNNLSQLTRKQSQILVWKNVLLLIYFLTSCCCLFYTVKFENSRLQYRFNSDLTSLRLWNNDKFSQYGVTDKTIFGISKYFKPRKPEHDTFVFRSISAGTNVETIDLGTCCITVDTIVSLIEVWKKTANCDLILILTNCQPVNKSVLKIVKIRMHYLLNLNFESKGFKRQKYDFNRDHTCPF